MVPAALLLPDQKNIPRRASAQPRVAAVQCDWRDKSKAVAVTVTKMNSRDMSRHDSTNQ
jgi:hypothetical protein